MGQCDNRRQVFNLSLFAIYLSKDSSKLCHHVKTSIFVDGCSSIITAILSALLHLPSRIAPLRILRRRSRMSPDRHCSRSWRISSETICYTNIFSSPSFPSALRFVFCINNPTGYQGPTKPTNRRQWRDINDQHFTSSSGGTFIIALLDYASFSARFEDMRLSGREAIQTSGTGMARRTRKTLSIQKEQLVSAA